MGKRIRKSDDFYQEALIWMGYRYAIGLTNFGREREGQLMESLKAFQGVEYDTPEFHALAEEIAKYLQRKKIKDVVDLSNQWIEVKESRDGSISYETTLEDDEKNGHAFSFSLTIDDLLAWDDLAKYFDPKMHKRCKVRFKGEEQIVEYFDSWRRKYGCEDEFPYEKLKRPVDSYVKNPQICTSLCEEYIVEDDL